MLGASQFRYGLSVIKGSHMAAVLCLPGVLLLVALGMIALDSSVHGASWGELQDAFGDVAVVWELIALATASVLAVAYVLVMRTSRLQLGFSEIDYYLPPLSGLGFSGVTTGRVRIPWSEVKSVHLRPGRRAQNLAQHAAGWLLEIESERGTLRFCPFNFVEAGGADHRLGLWEVVLRRDIDLEARLRQSPVVCALAARGFEVTLASGPVPRTAAVPPGFDLTTHKGLLVLLGIMAVAGGYAVTELVLLAEYQWLGPVPWLPIAVAGAAAVGACAGLGRGAPMLERLVVTALAAGTIAGAAYPGVMRFNLLTAAPQTVTYTAAAPGSFVAPNRPAIDLRDDNLAEYWSQYPAGSHYDFTLLEGSGGVMVDLGPLYEQTRAFYGGGSR